jgi:hypothetical protein
MVGSRSVELYTAIDWAGVHDHCVRGGGGKAFLGQPKALKILAWLVA